MVGTALDLRYVLHTCWSSRPPRFCSNGLPRLSSLLPRLQYLRPPLPQFHLLGEWQLILVVALSHIAAVAFTDAGLAGSLLNRQAMNTYLAIGMQLVQESGIWRM